MNIKQVLLFVFTIIFGIIVLYIINIVTHSFSLILFLLFSILWAVCAFFIVKSFLKAKVVLLVSILVIYYLIGIIPFESCHLSSFFGPIRQDCDCLGINKAVTFGFTDVYETQCIGIVKSKHCTDNRNEIISCK